MPNNDELVGTREAAEIGGVTQRTVARWVETGKLTPYAKIPGRTGAYLFRREDVEALAEPEVVAS